MGALDEASAPGEDLELKQFSAVEGQELSPVEAKQLSPMEGQGPYASALHRSFASVEGSLQRGSAAV